MVYPQLSEIKRLRKMLRISQTELATAANVAQSTIAKIEAQQQIPSYELGCNIFRVLLDRAEEIQPPVSELMNTDIISCQVTDSIESVMKLMKTHSISQLPVLDGLAIQGTVSEVTALELFTQHRDISQIANEPVSKFMDELLPIVPPITKLRDVIPLLKRFPAVLIASKGELKGILSKADLLVFDGDLFLF